MYMGVGMQLGDMYMGRCIAAWDGNAILAACRPCYCTLTIAHQYAGGEVEDGIKTASAAKCCQM